MYIVIALGMQLLSCFCWLGFVRAVKILIPYSRFPTSDETDRKICSASVFPILHFLRCWASENNIFQKRPGMFFELFWVVMQIQSENKGFLRVGGISSNPKNHEYPGLGTNPAKLDLTSALWSRIMLSPFLKTLFKICSIKITQKSKQISPIFSRYSP